MFRVLLVEDDAGDAILVERTLLRCQQQFSLQHCECLEDALNRLADNEFDVALLDLSLPDSFGLSALDKIRERAQDIPIVVLTGLSDDNLAMQSLEQGAQDYIVKGNETAELLERTLRYAVQRQQIQTENRCLLEKMEELAQQDPLTGVMNRHSFAESLEREWKRAERHQHPLACVVVDIDFFKRVNDTFGHAAGDRALQEVASLLCLNSRASDYVCRLGGEEFCALLTETDEAAALVWAERVRQAISELMLPVERDELRVTASFGVATCRDGSSKPQMLVDQADEAMFVAKQLGRDQVISFDRLRLLERSEPSQIWHAVTAAELMSPLEVSLAPYQSIREAIEVIQSGPADSVSVISTEGKLVGAIGPGDIMAAALTSGHFEGVVGQLMQRQLVTYAPETAAREVCEFLCRAAVQQVFVVDGTQPLGVIRRANVVRWLGESMRTQEAGRIEPLANTVPAQKSLQNTLTSGLA
jgi:diguanylate cyclase (GGDEF)-like protein